MQCRTRGQWVQLVLCSDWCVCPEDHESCVDVVGYGMSGWVRCVM